MAAVCVAALALAAMPAGGFAQEFGLKNLQGKVFDAENAPISGAIVYLQNSRNNDVKTYISEKDGSYRFAALSADTDYSVWAAHNGKKSATRTVSSFDTRKLVYLDLKVK
jgi:Carboxypeptidase regulatory-like domain